MDSTLNDESVVLELIDCESSMILGGGDRGEEIAQENAKEKEREEIFISTEEIGSWNLPLILSSRIVRIQANRDRLIHQSSYFSGLLGGSFSESSRNHVSILWNCEAVIKVLQFIFGCPLDVAADNFLPIFEGALFFGVETLLLECEDWFHRSISARGTCSVQLSLEALIDIWNFGSKHAIGFIPEVCTSYLARNFMWAVSCSSFAEVPYDFLSSCMEHPHLTVDSEKQLCEALLVWLANDHNSRQCSSTNFKDCCPDILKKCTRKWTVESKSIKLPMVRNPHSTCMCGPPDDWTALILGHDTYMLGPTMDGLDLAHKCHWHSWWRWPVCFTNYHSNVRSCLLPLDFIAEKRGNPFFSKLANETVSAFFDPRKDASISLPHDLIDDGYDNFQIRLTEYTKRIDLSGCTQITMAFLLLSTLPSSRNTDTSLRKRMQQFFIETDCLNRNRFRITQESLATLSFEAICEVDISRCPRLHLDDFIKCLYMLFPSLRILKASHCLHFKMSTLCNLMQKFPLVNEVDLTVDISPVIPMQVTITSSGTEGCPDYNGRYITLNEKPLLTNIAKLTLEGRTDINDSDLQTISALSSSLSHLNLKGCTLVTDMGMSKLICMCMNLCSLVVSDTCFGRNSVIGLCSEITFPNGFPGRHQEKHSSTLAFRLQKLHISGCKNVDQTSLLHLMSHVYMLKSLSLKKTSLVDDALFVFPCSSLENLDVSETMVSGTALAHIIRRNPGLKFLNARGCRNLHCCENELNRDTFPHEVLPFSGRCEGEELYHELSRTCILKEIEFGWGFSPLSLEVLRPAIRTLKSITVGLGASLGESALAMLPEICPLLEMVVLNFQVISDSAMRSIMGSLVHLQVLSLCCCLGDLTSLSFQFSMPKLRTLRLERVTPWMRNADLAILTQKCSSLHELSLSGCKLLDSDSQRIISSGWPGLRSIHLEDCGKLTSNGVSTLFDCKAVEDLLLRHNGPGIPRNFIADAASEWPLLRTVALDLCDAKEGGFDSLSWENRLLLSTVKIARCKSPKCSFKLRRGEEAWKRAVHKETIVLEWNSKELRTTIVKERV
ncbi:LOW QUALITY PROTEIN: BTB/POZ domain-containing protein FBL11 [Magnolia sinica]|uniref:LOW QUALITY PROTEIN: BTB/POZ domain-containing protein FBL11 n=1 Tax=Magnolia sinica TaxID=86752 RepID=UPI002659B340|nr:LOW QUALITY PROTEIN: BTB/POZ domain-containing protein FBL11 [Magnolia sinica]